MPSRKETSHPCSYSLFGGYETHALEKKKKKKKKRQKPPIHSLFGGYQAHGSEKMRETQKPPIYSLGCGSKLTRRTKRRFGLPCFHSPIGLAPFWKFTLLMDETPRRPLFVGSSRRNQTTPAVFPLPARAFATPFWTSLWFFGCPRRGCSPGASKPPANEVDSSLSHAEADPFLETAAARPRPRDQVTALGHFAKGC